MNISKHGSSSGIAPAQLYFNGFKDGMESDMSSAETLPVMQLLPDMPGSSTGSPKQQAVQAQSCDSGGVRGHSPDLLGRALHGRVGSFKQPAVPTTQTRKGQGYRRLWQMVSRVQRGERLSDTSAGREDVTVEDLVKTVQQLPASASAVEAIAAGLAYLDSRAAAALLKALAKAGLGQRAVEIFDYLRTLEPEHELYSLADIFTYTTMISQCNSHHQLRRALELVAEMRSRAVPLNVHTYSALLNVCLKANELDLSLDVYAQMLAEGCTPNLVTYNTLLDIYNKTGRWMDALNVLELLQHQNIKPEARTYNAIISTCNAAGRYAEAVRVHKVMCAAGVEPNSATFNAALTSYARSGQLDAGLGLFHAMAARGYERGANTYAAVLAACDLPGRWDLALELLQQMQSEGLRPSTACLTSAISACLHGGQPARAEQLFERMYTVCKPDAGTVNCLVCVYCRLGKHQQAVNMLEVMLRGGQHVDLTTYDAAIDACWATGVVPLQKYALQLYGRAHQQGLFQGLVSEQACAEGSLLDIQLPGGSPHVVLISLLHMLHELRYHFAAMGGAPCVGKVLLRLGLQGQDAKALSHVVTSQLCTLASPFVALPAPAFCNQPGMPAQVEELQFAADSLAVAEWLHGSAVAVALGVLSQSGPGIMPGMAGGMMGSRGVDGMMAAQEDAQRELKCRQAMMSVQAFERTCGINAQAIPQAALLQRAELVQALLRSAPCIGLAAEVAHDAVQLLDRALASPLAGNVSGRLLAAACLHITAHHDASSAPMLAALFQAGSPQQLLIAVAQVRQVLGGGCVTISAMRVLRLLLERLGVESDELSATRYVCGQALLLAGAAAQSAAFVGCPPSVVAVAVLCACRVAAGLLPAWPSALAALTGYDENSDVLQPYLKAAMQLLLEL
ncbi:hypothetical protein OEZ85_008599 [Tetradesmus obliquus]|uniref:PROP1-like PPR domain-containing protein n=1 Tax=Tetradesmus obliquus TaxID=3088 RepID=A0ABY8TLD5_TETOB|nr:hypothetical protein OEZ85_008599 [Tetradesmus obliquus]